MQFNVTNGPTSARGSATATRSAPGTARSATRTGTQHHPSIYDDFDAIMAAGRAAESLRGRGRCWAAPSGRAAYAYYGHDLFGVDVRQPGPRARRCAGAARRLLRQLRAGRRARGGVRCRLRRGDPRSSCSPTRSARRDEETQERRQGSGAPAGASRPQPTAPAPSATAGATTRGAARLRARRPHRHPTTPPPIQRRRRKPVMTTSTTHARRAASRPTGARVHGRTRKLLGAASLRSAGGRVAKAAQRGELLRAREAGEREQRAG